MTGWWLNKGCILGSLLLMCAVMTPPRLLAAGSIEGRVVNGTTDRPASGQTVQLLSPGKGGVRQTAATSTDANGHFAFTGSAIRPGAFYLVQALYQGVSYHAPVRPGAAATAANLKVYDSTSEPPHLTISSARFLVRAKGNKVQVEELYGLKNMTTPAVSYVNPAGTFSFNLGSGASQPSVEVVGKLNVPLPQDVRPGNTSGQYFIQYPLKPGLTVVIVAYHADYSSQVFSLSDSVPYPVDQIELDVSPPTLKVQSTFFKPAGNDPDSGGKKFLAQSLRAGSAIETGFSGAASSETAPDSSGEQTVKEIANPMTRLGLPLLGCFLLILLWAMGVRISKEWTRRDATHSGQPAQKQLEAKIEKLVNSIANLDEIFETGKIPEKRYWRERLDLKAKLVVLLKASPPAFLETYATRHNPS